MNKLLTLLFITVLLACDIMPTFAQENLIQSQKHEDGSINFENLKNQGIIFYQESKYQEALNCFERLDKSFLNTQILLLMSNCYSSQHNVKKSSELLIKAIEFDPDNSYTYYNLGILHYKNNNFKAAIENFDQAVNKNKGFAAAYYNLGVCYYLTQDFKKAKDSFNNALKLCPDNADICYSLVLTCNALNDKLLAEKYLDIYSKITKTDKTKDYNSSLESLKNNTNTVKPETTAKKEKSVSDKINFSSLKDLSFKHIKKLGF